MTNGVPQPPTGPIERFDKEHGPDYVINDNWVFFPNGASRENSTFPVMAQPPLDPVERTKVIIRFHELKLQAEIRAFDEFKRRRMLQKAHTTDADLDHLEQLQRVVLTRRERVAELREELKAFARDPGIKEARKVVERNRLAFEEAVAHLETAKSERRDAQELEILECQVTKADSYLRSACFLLVQRGGVVPDELDEYAAEAEQKAENLAKLSTQTIFAEQHRRQAIRNIEV